MGTDTDLRVQFVRLNLHRSLHTAEAISKHIHIPIARENTCFCFFIPFQNITPANLLNSLLNFWCHTITCSNSCGVNFISLSAQLSNQTEGHLIHFVLEGNIDKPLDIRRLFKISSFFQQNGNPFSS